MRSTILRLARLGGACLTAWSVSAGAGPLPAPAFDPLPGAEPHSVALRARLAAALLAKRSDYRPRTRHLREDGSARYANRLLLESSPYLQQHAHNPVDWYPWGEEAFAVAARSGRPVLLSIGYSTCHWCHVMEEESFEDLEIATYLNAHYVAIKVDREVRPDLDAIYMRAVQALTGRGGWPMTTWLTPQGEPFFGGTYFPARDGERGARRGFLTLLRTLAELYEQQPAQVVARAAELTAKIRQEATTPNDQAIAAETVLQRALSRYRSLFDADFGGLSAAPKFPSSLPLRLLLRSWRRTGDEAYREMAVLTLQRMADGGLYDQIGGGFHRYSTDERWLVPHFEKMLYDNAQLAQTYLEGFQATGEERFARIADETLRYVAREMTSKDGAFYSATDADSPTPDGRREEGRFFTWTPDEIRRELPAPRARLVEIVYGVTATGNFEGRNILHVARSIDEAARIVGVEPAVAALELEQARGVLYRARAKRPAPLRDDKILASWNGLMIAAFAEAARILDRPDYAKIAERAATFVLGRMSRDGRLSRSYHDGGARDDAYLDDYAFLVTGLLDLYEATGEVDWAVRAIELQETLDAHYWDSDAGGYFLTGDDHEALLTRDKPDDDGAEPSGNSVALFNLRRLHALTLDDRYRQRADRLLRAFGSRLSAYPTALSEMLLALDFQLADPREIILVGSGSRRELLPFLRVLRETYLPAAVLSVAVVGEDLERQARHLPPLRGKVAREGRPTAYVCRGGFCRLPVTDREGFLAELRDEVPETPKKTGSGD